MFRVYVCEIELRNILNLWIMLEQHAKFPRARSQESIFHPEPLGRRVIARPNLVSSARDRCFFFPPTRQQNVEHKPAFHRNGT